MQDKFKHLWLAKQVHQYIDIVITRSTDSTNSKAGNTGGGLSSIISCNTSALLRHFVASIKISDATDNFKGAYKYFLVKTR